jgi:hypothetical protein
MSAAKESTPKSTEGQPQPVALSKLTKKDKVRVWRKGARGAWWGTFVKAVDDLIEVDVVWHKDAATAVKARGHRPRRGQGRRRGSVPPRGAVRLVVTTLPTTAVPGGLLGTVSLDGAKPLEFACWIRVASRA